MDLDEIGALVRNHLEEKNAARDLALTQCRSLVRCSATAIRAAHRLDWPGSQEQLDEAHRLVQALQTDLQTHPDLFYAGYTRDALKEYAEARITNALLQQEELPSIDDVGVGEVPYVAGLGEAMGELRRQTLDHLRREDFEEAERLLVIMDEVYGLLVTLDFPDAITGNLRRITDLVRGVTERTRGDLTTSVQQRELKAALRAVEIKLQQS